MTPRQCALRDGLKQYVTGKPCKYGHIAPRLVSNNGCLECNRLKNRKRRKEDPLAASRECKLYRERHPNKSSEDSAAYYRNHKEKEKARCKAYRQKNADRYRELERLNNAAKVAKNAARRARKLNATPLWLTEEQRKEMQLFYKRCPKGYHVDHIIPLNGKFVCGLHVPQNLQYLTAEENLKKGNNHSDCHF